MSFFFLVSLCYAEKKLRKPALASNRYFRNLCFKKYLCTDTNSRDYNQRDNKSVHRGWRKVVVAAASATGVVLLVNTVFLVVATVRFKIDNGVGVIYEGDCGLVQRWDTALHLLINLLGTGLLAASSFTMQCLGAPTRSEVDNAHGRGVSLDIGLPTVKNLFYMKVWKGILWLFLCLSSLPLHLL